MGRQNARQTMASQGAHLSHGDAGIDVIQAGGHALDEFPYVSTLEGFHQLMPTEGCARSLESVRKYLLVEGE